MSNRNTYLQNSQALTETANFFRFGFGLGDEPYVKQYGQFVADVLHVDSTVIDDAIGVWSRVQTKFDAAAAVLLHQNDDVAKYAELKKPFVSNCLKAVPFNFDNYMNIVLEQYCNDNIYAVKYWAYTCFRDNEIDKATALYKQAAVWGDLFSIKTCERFCASDKDFWDKLYIFITQDISLGDNDIATKVAKSIKLLRLYDYKPYTVVRDAASAILSDASLSDIDVMLRTRSFISCTHEKSKIGFTANINTEGQNG